MAIVYVPQLTMQHDKGGYLKPKFNLEPAQEYGNVVVLLSGNAKPFNPAPIIRELWHNLSDFTPEDYILAIGNPCIIGWAVSIASNITGGKIRMLQWHGVEKKYCAIHANLLPTIPAPNNTED